MRGVPGARCFRAASKDKKQGELKMEILTDADKEQVLKCYGGNHAQAAEDMPQIERTARKARYELLKSDGSLLRSIARHGAIRLLGREKWICGIVRAAFHWTAMRELEDGRMVYFECRPDGF